MLCAVQAAIQAALPLKLYNLAHSPVSVVGETPKENHNTDMQLSGAVMPSIAWYYTLFN